MSWSTYFVQECPTCGRRLQIHVRNLGSRVSCAHCLAEFIAKDAHGESAGLADPIESVDPIEELLTRAESYLLESTAAPRKPR